MVCCNLILTRDSKFWIERFKSTIYTMTCSQPLGSGDSRRKNNFTVLFLYLIIGKPSLHEMRRLTFREVHKYLEPVLFPRRSRYGTVPCWIRMPVYYSLRFSCKTDPTMVGIVLHFKVLLQVICFMSLVIL